MVRTVVSCSEIRSLAAEILMGLNVPKNDAQLAVDVMMDAELSGIESHGLMRLKPYADRIAQNMID